jgi:hypothetical protein
VVPEDCKKFHTCNASICPLDPSWPGAVHLPGEQVCQYLLATGKTGADGYYDGDPAYRECLVRLPLVAARHPEIARRVEAAARSGFRGQHLRRPKPVAGAVQDATDQGVTAAIGPGVA